MPINSVKIAKSKQINLLPQDDFQSSTLGRVLKWALSSFRVMVIITELVVMSAFLSRFWLDARNSDLNESLNLNKAKVLAFKETEDEFRRYQQKLSISKSLYSESKNSTLVNDITKIMPEDISIQSIQRNDEGVQVKATGLSERSIAQFIVNMGNIKYLSDVNLSQVSSSVENSYATNFTISAKIISQIGGTK